MESTELRHRLDFAIASARRAGALVMDHYRKGVSIERKADDSPVTVADRQAEQMLRGAIADAFPSDGVLGEEFGESGGTSGWRWVLDPIDGTQSFIRGVPLFGVLVGAEFRDNALLGVAFMPALDEMVYAALGQGCWWIPAATAKTASPIRAHVSSIVQLADGLVLTTSYDYWVRSGNTKVFQRVAEAAKTRGWSDCYAHVLVATGRAEAAIEPVMSIWDSAPFLPILSEAGGTYTDWAGMPTISASRTISSNGKVLGELLKLVNS